MPKWTRTHRVHGSWLLKKVGSCQRAVAKSEIAFPSAAGAHQIHQNGTWNISAAGGLVEVHIEPFQLQIAAALVRAGGVYAVLVTYNLHDINNTEGGLEERKIAFTEQTE